MMKSIAPVARREFDSFFASPAAFLFLAAFIGVTLFTFFWVERFFARNLADIRPLFEWMPVLLIFLVAALTMRAWSEERRSGTAENLLTRPISSLALILGKFVATVALVAVALALTLPLVFSVAVLGPLDWGPVIGGYVAAVFLAAAYAAIGLFMSARTDNPIVALIMTVALCSLLYIIGEPTLTGLFGNTISTMLSAAGTGARFDSITRGVLDLRDLYYYLSIVGVFLSLNLLTLESLRWTGNPASATHNRARLVAGLLIANFIAANLWLGQINVARIDLTEESLYSLSDTTHQYLEQVQEPLLIRGYFSEQTHPLLAPLVPGIRNLLEEYDLAGGDQVTVEFVDPHANQAMEEEAASRYGIRPVPFQVASRHQSSVVSSYFDIVIAYGDQHEVLNFQDLIEVKAAGEGDIDVALKNPEYALSRSIRKVQQAYQRGGNPFTSLQNDLVFSGYMSSDQILPESLRVVRVALLEVLEELQNESGGRLRVEFADPDANGGQLAAELSETYGLGPLVAGLFDPQPFWFYMLMSNASQDGASNDTLNNTVVQIPIPQELAAVTDSADALDGSNPSNSPSNEEDALKNALRQSMTAAVARLTPGFLKTIAVAKPPAPAMNPQLGMAAPPGGKRYTILEQVLNENARTLNTDLATGSVSDEADLLMVMAPTNLDEKSVFAIDQFLMRGGTVLMATSPFDVQIAESLNASRHNSGVSDWLNHHGIEIQETMVLDPQNAALPIPVERNIGGFPIREIRMLDYPHFPDLRTAGGSSEDPAAEGLASDHPITRSLGQLTVNWASPIKVADTKTKTTNLKATRLMQSTAQSWLSDDLNVIPDPQRWPESGFATPEQRTTHTLALLAEGRFRSWFEDRENPLNAQTQEITADGESASTPGPSIISSVIASSPEQARLLVIGSNMFGTDIAVNLTSEGMGTLYTKQAEFLQNAIDWALEDSGLLQIRSRTQYTRTLLPLSSEDQKFWEYLNYALAIVGLMLVGVLRILTIQRRRAGYEAILSKLATQKGAA